jgi:hypothetical protein
MVLKVKKLVREGIMQEPPWLEAMVRQVTG